jgi:hypothetical protein
VVAGSPRRASHTLCLASSLSVEPSLPMSLNSPVGAVADVVCVYVLIQKHQLNVSLWCGHWSFYAQPIVSEGLLGGG